MIGTGLGLSLSKSLVELHGGSIAAKSSKGRGSRFTVTLPLGKAHLREGQAVGEAAQQFQDEAHFFMPEIDVEPAVNDEKNATAAQQILIIEDNADLQFFLKKKLSAAYQVVPATDGNDGLQKAFDLTPDLIICDIMLPGTNGLDITRSLKSDLRTSHIPIVILSARSSVEQQIEGTETGADAYVTKPFNFHFLLANIKSLLLNRQVLRESYGRGLSSFSPQAATPEPPAGTNPLDAEFLKRFIAYIEQHHARQDFQVSDLCREFGQIFQEPLFINDLQSAFSNVW